MTDLLTAARNRLIARLAEIDGEIEAMHHAAGRKVAARDEVALLLAELPTGEAEPVPAKPKRAGNGEVERAVLAMVDQLPDAPDLTALTDSLPGYLVASVRKAAARLVADQRLVLDRARYTLPGEPARGQAAE